MKIYVAGPMRGIPEFNFPAFNAATTALRAQGHTVFNPAERDINMHGNVFGSTTGDMASLGPSGFSLREALAADTQWIALEADALCVLPGWENSKGALAETALATALGLEINPLEAYVGI